jgi:hypothetical protein
MEHRARQTQAVAEATSDMVSCRLDEIRAPGLYLEHRTGALLRVHEEALAPGKRFAIEVVANWNVTRLSKDPGLPLPEARMLAAHHDLIVDI